MNYAVFCYFVVLSVSFITLFKIDHKDRKIENMAMQLYNMNNKDKNIVEDIE